MFLTYHGFGTTTVAADLAGNSFNSWYFANTVFFFTQGEHNFRNPGVKGSLCVNSPAAAMYI